MSAREVLVVGAGPAGMAAAAAVAEGGCRVRVIDENASAGGQIWRGYGSDPKGGAPRFARLMQRLAAAQVEMVAGTRVVAQPAKGVLRVEGDAGSGDLSFDKLILATGARERFLPFPGWTLPGVLGTGGLQAMVKAGLPIAGKRVVLAGSGPLLLAVAANLAKQGAEIAGIFEQAPMSRLMAFGVSLMSHPGKIVEGLRYGSAVKGAGYRTSAWVTRADGTDRLMSVTVSIGGKAREIGCDYLGCGFHLVPNLELPRLLGCATEEGFVRVDAGQQSSVEGVYCAGELTGVGGLEKALIEGEIAGLAAAGRSAVHLFPRRDRQMRFARKLDEAFALRGELGELAAEDTIVCRCEDVRRGALEGMRSGREAKLHTRCGMGPCQGRVCGPATLFLFGWDAESVRPPITPARIETIAADVSDVASAQDVR
ncbi:NAD(P)/FAD-dependent oxidoreductase [Occallatibacter riparius]|uniref:NAD(P)/FAD-dependent oxidoreductase n=1 Tax=Occallatibacter riparius TaxID=1002689 RepID=A0A9J7BH39_9BACT|nr:FAD/NAD(P)-binding oxidoreductase [Occallatibacter riparius]UWZ81707.1 NAD(P)/FAD-dependent oxidoreductase [Occallatibacter riparius]